MVWIIFLILTIVLWGTYNLFFKAMGSEMNYFLALMFIGIAQFSLSIPFVFNSYINNNLDYSYKWIVFSLIMGILLGLGTIAFFYTFKFGANTSIAIPIYSVGALLLGVIGGLMIFHENLNIQIIIGIILGVISIILLTYG